MLTLYSVLLSLLHVKEPRLSGVGGANAIKVVSFPQCYNSVSQTKYRHLFNTGVFK